MQLIIAASFGLLIHSFHGFATASAMSLSSDRELQVVKVDVCHKRQFKRNGPIEYVLRQVSVPNVDYHLDHGDALVGEPIPDDPEGRIFGPACEPVEPTPTVVPSVGPRVHPTSVPSPAPVAPGPSKVVVCHKRLFKRTGPTEYDLRLVSVPHVAYHLDHGDALVGEPIPDDPEGRFFGAECEPVAAPSTGPSSGPTSIHSSLPSVAPSGVPTPTSSLAPSAEPSAVPTLTPTVVRSNVPSASPSGAPSPSPSVEPSSEPRFSPSLVPSSMPIGVSSEPVCDICPCFDSDTIACGAGECTFAIYDTIVLLGFPNGLVCSGENCVVLGELSCFLSDEDGLVDFEVTEEQDVCCRSHILREYPLPNAPSVSPGDSCMICPCFDSDTMDHACVAGECNFDIDDILACVGFPDGGGACAGEIGFGIEGLSCSLYDDNGEVHLGVTEEQDECCRSHIFSMS